MKKIKILALASSVSAGIFGASGVLAFEDGSLDSTSQGNFEIRYLKDPKVQISKLEDVVFPTNAIQNHSVSTEACLHSTSARATIKLTSGNTDRPFALESSIGSSTLDYEVSITGDTLQDSADKTSNSFTPETVTWNNTNQEPTTPPIWDAALLADCNGSTNLDISTKLLGNPETDGLAEGEYKDIVTLYVEPV